MAVYEDDINIIISWLKSKNCGIWAQWDISDSDEVVLAAEWIRGVMAGLSEYSDWYQNTKVAG